MATYTININGTSATVTAEESTPLLWVIREQLGLMGTKYGCGVGQCGACTIHVNGVAMKSCTLPVEAVSEGQNIKTIEGLSADSSHPLQEAWIAAQVPQCGYCQSGQIMQAATLLEQNAKPSREEIKKHMNGNLCRCGTYLRIIKAIEMAAGKEGLTSI